MLNSRSNDCERLLELNPSFTLPKRPRRLAPLVKNEMDGLDRRRGSSVSGGTTLGNGSIEFVGEQREKAVAGDLASG